MTNIECSLKMSIYMTNFEWLNSNLNSQRIFFSVVKYTTSQTTLLIARGWGIASLKAAVLRVPWLPV